MSVGEKVDVDVVYAKAVDTKTLFVSVTVVFADAICVDVISVVVDIALLQ